MTKVRVAGVTVSIDGYAAGPDQSLDNPLGRGGEELHPWLVSSRTFHAMIGEAGGSTGIDDRFAARSMQGLGAFIMGRNMFGPIRGDWPDRDWKGWWGDNPPYHTPTFVLSHYPREPETMQGGTTFHFETRGIEAALDEARAAAGGKDIRILGGPATIRQYLASRLIDELHIAITPILLGRGEPLFAGMDLPALGYRVRERTEGEAATHVVLDRMPTHPESDRPAPA